jgi:hypothetical protein
MKNFISDEKLITIFKRYFAGMVIYCENSSRQSGFNNLKWIKIMRLMKSK